LKSYYCHRRRQWFIITLTEKMLQGNFAASTGTVASTVVTV